MEEKPNRKARARKTEPAGAEILAAEIATLRGLMRQVAKLAESGATEEADLELLQILNSFGLASARLVTLLKAQRGLGSEDTEVAFHQALEEALQELQS
jgi:hypothetical protein